MKYIRIGKIVNTHGIKGELRILSDFKYKNKIFNIGQKIYIGQMKNEEIINSYRIHKNFDMITLREYDNINDVLKYKGEYVFINKEDLVLDPLEFLNEDLIGMDIYTSGKLIGKLIKIVAYPSSEMLVIKGLDKEYLVPFVSEFIEDIDTKNKIIKIKYIKGLFE